ncbi:glycosyltransferase [Streptacidiphilus albus]|uniref:glycosyltransferase n=1 Tax=Streptacidiphilus albus TaxID=105425 RepID=UPI0009DFBC7C|nr:glycosyltransferase [Streptacidiphilus albus]
MDTHWELSDDDDSVPSTVSDPASDSPGTVVVVIPARNEASRIALTVLAARKLPRVGPIVVVDDGSTDSTWRVAEESGARVLRLPHPVGRAEAQRRGVVAARETAGSGRLCLLFLDADLGASAAEAAALLAPVLAGTADVALGVPTGGSTGGSGVGPGGGSATVAAGAASRRARLGIRRATGFDASYPLAGELCLGAAAFGAIAPQLSSPVATGPGLIIDLLRQDFRVVEVPLALAHRPSRHGLQAGLRAGLRELRRYREVGRELSARQNSR